MDDPFHTLQSLFGSSALAALCMSEEPRGGGSGREGVKVGHGRFLRGGQAKQPTHSCSPPTTCQTLLNGGRDSGLTDAAAEILDPKFVDFASMVSSVKPADCSLARS